MKPVAYITSNGILYKELPPDAILELTPLEEKSIKGISTILTKGHLVNVF